MKTLKDILSEIETFKSKAKSLADIRDVEEFEDPQNGLEAHKANTEKDHSEKTLAYPDGEIEILDYLKLGNMSESELVDYLLTLDEGIVAKVKKDWGEGRYKSEVDRHKVGEALKKVSKHLANSAKSVAGSTARKAIKAVGNAAQTTHKNRAEYIHQLTKHQKTHAGSHYDQKSKTLTVYKKPVNESFDPEKLQNLKKVYGDFRTRVGKANKENMEGQAKTEVKPPYHHLLKTAKKMQKIMHESTNGTFSKGHMKLKDGSTVSLTEDDAKVLAEMYNSTSDAGKKSMVKTLNKSKKDFESILSFARSAK